MVQGGLKKVQGGLEPPLAPHFPRLCAKPKFQSHECYFGGLRRLANQNLEVIFKKQRKKQFCCTVLFSDSAV